MSGNNKTVKTVIMTLLIILIFSCAEESTINDYAKFTMKNNKYHLFSKNGSNTITVLIDDDWIIVTEKKYSGLQASADIEKVTKIRKNEVISYSLK